MDVDLDAAQAAVAATISSGPAPDTEADAADPLWYKDAVVYQVHVRSFFDSNDDGYGDFEGLRQKLPHLEELGVNCLWIMPFYDSPLRDDGYDISDYLNILPVHGNLDDFKRFLDEAHARGMRVITELVLNHTSDQHAWFQEARRPGSPKRDWYVWSDTAERYKDVRIIFTDTEHSNWTWDPVAGAYYWHRFFSHQPDLNWDNPELERVLHEVMFYWLDMGVDGLRLDAIPYLYEREGTSGENLPETLDAIKRLRKAMDDRYNGTRVLLAEANQWPEDTLPYFGTGDGVQMAFNFPLMPRMYMALRRENRQPIVEMLGLTEGIPESAQWALFLRNHDELTLEMVTDEERDYMYNEYASDRQFRLNLGIRRRLAPLLGGERRRIELMNALVLSLKGSPILYYGDEIGMGDNTFLGDRNGVRTPMQWSPDRNGGFSRAPFHQLFMPPINEGPYGYQFVNVEDAQRSAHSLYGFMRRILRLRNQHGKTFGRGTLTVLPVENQRVFAFLREYEGETVLVVANLSRFAQAAYLPLESYTGSVPIELFSQAPFPAVEASEKGYPITMSPHGFYWFVLKPEAEGDAEAHEDDGFERKLPTLRPTGGLETVLVDTLVQGDARRELERALPEYLSVQRWFGSKTRPLKSAKLVDAIRLQAEPQEYLAIVRAEFGDGGTERYFLPLALKSGEAAQELLQAFPRAALAWLSGPSGRTLLHDATASADFWTALYRAAGRDWRGRSLQGQYAASATKGVTLPAATEARVMGVEQSNSSAVLEGQEGAGAFGKLYRKLEDESNPEVEMLSYLTEAGFPFAPPLLGSLTFRRGAQPLTLGIFQGFIAGGDDAWAYALEETARYLGRTAEATPPENPYPERYDDPVPAWLEDSAGEPLQLASLLGVRTAELHTALSKAEAPALRPEPVTSENLQAFTARVRRDAEETVRQLERAGQPLDRAALERGLAKLGTLAQTEPDWHKIRVHGDYHLGQVIRAESELYILDFEGEPARPLNERRERDGALRDTAGMLRSLEYAGLVAGREYGEQTGSDVGVWADLLVRWGEAAFLEAYLSTAGDEATYLPKDAETRSLILWAYMLEKVLYEVRYELGSRPDWVWLPLRGLERLLS